MNSSHAAWLFVRSQKTQQKSGLLVNQSLLGSIPKSIHQNLLEGLLEFGHGSLLH